MGNAITCYIVRDDLLILVPDSEEMSARIRNHIGPPPAGVEWLILAPGSSVVDLRDEAPETATDYTMRRLRGNQ